MGPDEELIAGCLKRDKRSWDAFVDRFSKLVWWSIRKTLSGTRYQDREDIFEDIFQDVFERLLERGELEKLRSAESVRKFLSVMACHLALDRAKGVLRFEKKSATLEAVPADLAAKDGRDPRSEALLREAQAGLAAALEDLSVKEKACIELRYLEGLPDVRIAVILGLPVDTVSSIVRRSREKLKKILSEKGLEI